MVKVREFPESNYKGIWFGGKTIRVALDPKKGITELKYPEFYDIKITDHCKGGCPDCYMDSTVNGREFDDIVDKVHSYFGEMSPNQRPFQVAIGGGEPTTHPDFIMLLEELKSLGIEPNYTTNGMNITDDILQATNNLCGGVALSCHPHLEKHWESAAYRLSTVTRLNFHLIISDRESIDYFMDVYEKWSSIIDYFVLLPYGVQGRAVDRQIDWDYLVKKLPLDTAKIAFGANFYDYLKGGGHDIKVSLYEPEILSKFLDLKDMKLYPSSFNLEEAI